VRSASRGKPFWHAETYAGPLWMQPQVLGKPRDEGRIASPEDIRYWDLVSYMAGARGMLYLRWRPLLDGALFGAFGAYGMDGSRTPRSEMVSRIGKWATDPARSGLWQARSVQGDIGILYVPETQLFTYAQQGSTTFYAQAMQGAYRAFFRHNIQADWVHLSDIDSYDLLYLPFPVMLSRATAESLRRWVERGGMLIAEGCPAYFGDRGHVGAVQPNYGLHELFGARESDVEFTPDILGDLRFTVDGLPVWGGTFMQVYQPTTGTAVGWYEDGRVAVVDHAYGRGRTRLVGTIAGAGYAAHGPVGGHEPDPPAPFFASLLRWAGRRQHITSSEPRVQARLQHGSSGAYLWVANPTRHPHSLCLELSEAWGPYAASDTLWGAPLDVQGRIITLTAPPRDVTIAALR
jgi:beta-galactosidase